MSQAAEKFALSLYLSDLQFAEGRERELSMEIETFDRKIRWSTGAYEITRSVEVSDTAAEASESARASFSM